MSTNPADLPQMEPGHPYLEALEGAADLVVTRLREIPELREAAGRLLLVFEADVPTPHGIIPVHLVTCRPPTAETGFACAEFAVTAYTQKMRPQG